MTHEQAQLAKNIAGTIKAGAIGLNRMLDSPLPPRDAIVKQVEGLQLELERLSSILPIPRTAVESSNIAEIGWRAGVLEVLFTSGGVYQYRDVPRSVFDEFLTADSKGQYLNSRIKSLYAYEKLAA